MDTLLAALETAPLDAHDFRHLEVKLCSLARRFLGSRAYVFEGGRIVRKLGAAVTRGLALCLPVVIQLRQRRLKWLRTSVSTPRSSLRYFLVERAPSKERWDAIACRASPSGDHRGRP